MGRVAEASAVVPRVHCTDTMSEPTAPRHRAQCTVMVTHGYFLSASHLFYTVGIMQKSSVISNYQKIKKNVQAHFAFLYFDTHDHTY